MSMSKLIGSEHFHDLFLNNTPLLDVRAPIEFSDGAFPAAMNLPLLDDEQRRVIGIEYKRAGKEAAIKLGTELATPAVREQRVEAWRQILLANPNAYLYCFRGGMRSHISQQWLADCGIHIPLIAGGYKALRRYLLTQLERLALTNNTYLLAGTTGIGKTELIQAIDSAVDLEGRSNHRGSAFGGTFLAQPSQIDWENQITIDWLQCEARVSAPVLIEAESHLIGRIHVPSVLQRAMREAPVILLEASMRSRCDRLFTDYVEHGLKHFQRTQQDPWPALQTYIQSNLDKIRKRLGGLRHKELSLLLAQAIIGLRDQQDPSEFHQMIEILLRDYYDPFYRHHHKNYESRIVCRGNEQQVREFLASSSLGKSSANGGQR